MEPFRARLVRKSLVTVATVLVFVACSDSDPRADGPRTIAFLRAFPGGASDAELLHELTLAGYRQDRDLRVLAADPSETHLEPEDVRATVKKWLAQDVDLIFAFSTRGALAARETAPDTDIVFLVNDPVAVGLVKNEDAPEGRLTGATFRVPADRTLALAKRAIPGARRAGLIYSSVDPAAQPHRLAVQRAADQTATRLYEESFADDADIVPAISRLLSDQVDYILMSNSPASVIARTLIQKAVAGRVPIVANTDVIDFAIMSLDPDVPELYRQIGRMGARLLDGSPMSAVPVEDPRAYRLTLNRRVADAFDIAFPAELEREADRVIL